jgi:hypothetical protein
MRASRNDATRGQNVHTLAVDGEVNDDLRAIIGDQTPASRKVATLGSAVIVDTTQTQVAAGHESV